MTYPTLSKHEIAQKIDHTLLRPTLTRTELEKTCLEAVEYRFKTVCIPPSWVKEAARLVKGTDVGTITVVGFPLGYTKSSVKALEARSAIEDGATEIDMVINLSYLKSDMTQELEADVAEVVRACGSTPLKVILETAYLTETEKTKAALAAERAGASFLKTSTGFASGVSTPGATLADIQLLRKTLHPGTQIKASGGIRDLNFALSLIHAGADRLGTSSGIAILEGLAAEGAY